MTTGLYLAVAALALTIAAIVTAAPVRRAAALLLVPALLWTAFIALLNFQIDRANPDAETLVTPAATTQISIGKGPPPDEGQ
ncbi:tryptophan-rich sensory protein [Sphingopyxis sp. PET50]|uniref:tryptophan-rich sensory protein n=1 Tax=Sphingopyxis sp. PET50 TaxID=2976533 RepID=UPI0021B06C6E|nr:tryptophan-rich sensory protein [Sphingopyxis sp. PET50]